MTDKPVTTYVVSVYKEPFWVDVLTTKDKAKAEALAKEIGDKVRIEEITPKPKKRQSAWNRDQYVHVSPAGHVVLNDLKGGIFK